MLVINIIRIVSDLVKYGMVKSVVLMYEYWYVIELGGWVWVLFNRVLVFYIIDSRIFNYFLRLGI